MRPFFTLFCALLLVLSCGTKKKYTPKSTGEPYKMDYSTHPLPAGIRWVTNNKEPLLASPKAKRGGTFYSRIESFPLTFRVVGPDSNNTTRSHFLNNHMSLLDFQSNTEKLMPSLATHWAYGADRKTMYFKLDPRARWSDGRKVTADDYIYTVEFMRSKMIRAPWYNNFYNRIITSVRKYGPYTISVTAARALPDLWLYVNLRPIAQHFYGHLTKDFVRRYNWAVEPNTGPYQLYKYSKGRYLLFKRKKNWWANSIRHYRNRFNPEYIRYTVIRDKNVTYQYFRRGHLDAFRATLSDDWHILGKGDIFSKGYVHKLCFYVNRRQPTFGLYLNLKKPIFKDIRLREALAHAINFEMLNEKIFYGEYTRLQTFYTGYGDYTNKRIRARTYSIKKVETLMTRAGWKRGKDGIWTKGGKRYSVKITFSRPHYRERVVVLQEEARKAGIELVINQLDPSTGYKEVMEKKHQIAYMGWSTSFRPSPWQTFHSANANKPQTNNINNLADPLMDRLINRYRRSTTDRSRIFLSHQIQKRLHDLCVWIPLEMTPFVRAFHWRWLRYPRDPGPKTMTHLFTYPAAYGYFWIDEDMKRKTKEAKSDSRAYRPVTTINTTHKRKY